MRARVANACAVFLRRDQLSKRFRSLGDNRICGALNPFCAISAA